MYDRYKGVRELMPYAKAVSAKSHEFDEKGNEVKTDYLRMMKIVLDHGYNGYVGVEYEGRKVDAYQGIVDQGLPSESGINCPDEIAHLFKEPQALCGWPSGFSAGRGVGCCRGSSVWRRSPFVPILVQLSGKIDSFFRRYVSIDEQNFCALIMESQGPLAFLVHADEAAPVSVALAFEIPVAVAESDHFAGHFDLVGLGFTPGCVVFVNTHPLVGHHAGPSAPNVVAVT